MKKISSEIKRLYKAFFYSIDGLKEAYKTEPAFRIEIFVAIVAIPLALCFDVSGAEKALLIGSVILVLIAELINSAIEAVVDRISEDIHHLSKKAKDVGSATVLVAIINAFIVWALVLFG